MTESRIALLKGKTCPKGACWEGEAFTDGGVEAVAGPGWRCFMAERHFTDNACGTMSKTVGGFCDAIAVNRQPSNRAIRVIEVKTQAKFAQAKDQLRKGVEFVLGLPGVSSDAVSVELHVKQAPRVTIRPRQRDFVVGTHRYRIQLFAGGEPQFR